MLIEQMPLRITFQDGEDVLTMKIEGKLAGPQVNELSRAWHCAAPSLGHRRLVIDLHDLIFMDKAGIAVLAQICCEAGAQFSCDSPLTKHFAEEVLCTAIEEMKGAA
jgi:anti-anti-sigma factor